MVFYLVENKKYVDFNTLLYNSLIKRSSLYRILKEKISKKIMYQNKMLYSYDEIKREFGDILLV